MLQTGENGVSSPFKLLLCYAEENYGKSQPKTSSGMNLVTVIVEIFVIFVNFGHTKNTEIYSAHAHAMPLEIVLHMPE